MTTAAVPIYLKLYDKAGKPNVANNTPIKVLIIPGGDRGSSIVYNSARGIFFEKGLAFVLTTGVADNDATPVEAEKTVINLDYEVEVVM